MNEYLDFAKELAYEAGEIMRKYFLAEDLGLTIKGDDSPVTLADTKVNSLVISRVKQRFPDHGVLGEEESFNIDSKKLWIVDPVDGTSAFARGVAGWVFSLAYCEDGQPKVAVVFDPILERLMFAADGLGAFENSRQLKIAKKDDNGTKDIAIWLAGGLKGVALKDPTIDGRVWSELNRKFKAFPADLPIAHAIALVGTGRIDASLTSVKNPWDVAAGGYIASMAGARVTDLFGNRIERWDKEVIGIIAAEPSLHKKILEIVSEFMKEAELQ